MANTIQIKRRPYTGQPGSPNLKYGEIAYNEREGILYYGWGTDEFGDALNPIYLAGSGAYVLKSELSNALPENTIPGTFTKVDVNAKGIVTSGTLLASGDIPTLSKAQVNDINNLTNDRQVKAINSSTDGYIPTWNGVLGDSLNTGYAVETTLNGSSTAIPRADAVKNYVDALKQGLDIKDSVRVATTIGLGQYGTNTNTIYALEDVRLPDIDGVTLNAGDRILIKNETSTEARYNGIYYVDEVGVDGDVPWRLRRATDADSSSEVTAGMFVFVSEGTANGDTGWVLTTNDTITLNSTQLSFSQFSAAGQMYDGSGLFKQGNIIHVGTASTNRIVVNADNIDLATVSRSDNTGAGVGITFPRFITTDSYGRLTVVSSGTIQSASTAQKGIAQFNSDNFNVTLGAVSLKNVVNTTGNQAVTGVKTFYNQPVLHSGLSIPHGNGSANIYIGQINLDNSNIYFDTDDNELHVAYKETLQSTTFTAGSGLTGGGNLGGSRIFHVGSGDGIVVNENDVAVDSTVIRTFGDQTICGPKTFGGSDLDHYILNFETSADGSGIIAFSDPTIKMYLMFDGLNNELKIKEFAGNDEHKFNITTYTKLRASGTASAATHIPVFTSDPTTSSQTLHYRTPTQFLSDINAVSLSGDQSISGIKTFNNDVNISGNLNINGNTITFNQATVTLLNMTATSGGFNNLSSSGLAVIAQNTQNNDVGYFAVFDSNPNNTITTLKSVSKDQILDDIGAATSGLTLTAGSGLQGGGTLSENRTFDVITGDGIQIVSDAVAVDSTVVRTSGNQIIGDKKTFNQIEVFPTGTSPGGRATLRIGHGSDYYYDFYSGVGSTASGYLLAGIHSDTSYAPFRVVINNTAGTSSITNATWDATTIAVDKGGTGQTSYTNGELLIGNTTGNTLTKATLTEGNGIDITNGNGSISIAIDNSVVTTSNICTAFSSANCGIDGGTF